MDGLGNCTGFAGRSVCGDEADLVGSAYGLVRKGVKCGGVKVWVCWLSTARERLECLVVLNKIDSQVFVREF